MPLTKCAACGGQISTEAEACPHCGHPNHPAAPASTGPKCYACPAPATTKCQSCGTLSCVQHVQSIFVRYGQGGAYELRCESCYSSAVAWRGFGWVLGAIAFIIFLIILFTVILPKYREFDQKFNDGPFQGQKDK
jgi:hypothetical protein